MPEIRLPRPVRLDYRSLSHEARCKLDGSPLTLWLTLAGDTSAPPDVLDVERWLAHACRVPLVVEELALAAADAFGLAATARGRTDAHGTLTATAYPVECRG